MLQSELVIDDEKYKVSVSFFIKKYFRPQNAGALAHKMQVRLNINLQLLHADKKCKLLVSAFRTVPWLNPYLFLQT